MAAAPLAEHAITLTMTCQCGYVIATPFDPDEAPADLKSLVQRRMREHDRVCLLKTK